MVIIAFSTKTSKILPRVACRNFRHAAPIIPTNNGGLVMYQFTSPRQITRIYMNKKTLGVLRKFGWQFIYVRATAPSPFVVSGKNFKVGDIQKCKIRAYSCVNLCKCAMGIKAPYIQTPDGLYKYLTRC